MTHLRLDPNLPEDSVVIRKLIHDDIEQILQLQQLAYRTSYLETAASYAVKITIGEHLCFGAWLNGQLIGHLVAVPLLVDASIDLDSSRLDPVEMSDARVIYIHDLAVHPNHRGTGLSDDLLANMFQFATEHHIEAFNLVAVQHSTQFWAKRGFVASTGLLPKGYGPEAVLMSRR